MKWLYRERTVMSKILLVMRLIIVLLTTAILQVSASGYAQKITLSERNTSLQQVLMKVKAQSGYNVLYASESLNGASKINLQFDELPLELALEQIFKNQKLGFELKNKTIVVKERLSSVQTILVKGTVTDVEGKAIEGVSVSFTGAKTSTITNDKGEYAINVPTNNAVLVFFSIGYLRQEVKVNNRQRINIVLQHSISKLDEVVVMGYGTVRKSDVTGSVSKLELDNPAEKGINTIGQLLQGRVSGVNITQTSGAPGSGVTFNIRGTNSLGSNQPLIVIDGYPVDDNAVTPILGTDAWAGSTPAIDPMANLNPNDIESIEILKDASSTAIYGSRGANGVVLITTKQGKVGRDAIAYSFRSDFGKLPKQIPMLGSVDYMRFTNEGLFNSGITTPRFTEQQIADQVVNTNWQDLIYRTAISQDHQLSFTGGDKKTRYSVSANYTKMNGIVKLSDYNRGGLRANINRQISDKFKLGLNFNTTLSKSRGAMQSMNHDYIGASVVGSALRFNPLLQQSYTEDGDFDLEDPLLQSNPLLTIEKIDNDSKINTLGTNINAEYTILKGLAFKVNGGFNRVNSLRQQYFRRGTFQGNNSNGSAYWGMVNNFNYLTEYTLSYNKEIKKHRINAVGGYTFQNWKVERLGVQARSFTNDNLGYNALQYAGAVNTPATAVQEWALASFLSRINYSFANKYLVTFTGRYDGSSRLAAGHKWDFFPSLGLGWNAHNESFMKTLPWISQFKVRGSYGLSGSQSVPVGSTQALITSYRSAVNIGNVVTGTVLSGFENKDLGWETTKQFNLGADLSFEKNKYTLTIDLYKKTTTDLLISTAIPSDNGFTAYMANAGKIENRGIEFDASARLLSKGLKWTLSGNIAFNRNKVIDVGATPQIFGRTLIASALGKPASISQPGSAIGAFYGFKVIGIYQNADEVTNGPVDNINPQPGDFKYADVNADGIINEMDRTIIGNPNPDYTFGITNEFSYRKINLSFLVYGSIGADVVNLNRYWTDGMFAGGTPPLNTRQEAYDGRWVGEGTSNYYPRPKNTGSLLDSRFSDFIVEDATFVRLKNISLSYDLPVSKIKFVQKLSLFVTGDNLITITKYKGYDPEVSGLGSDGMNRGIDYSTIPVFRTYSFGVKASF